MAVTLSETPHVGDIGTIIKIRAFEDDSDYTLENATVVKLLVWKPGSSTSVDWTGIIDPDDNRWAKYTVVSGDFSIAGTYKIKLYAYWDASNVWTGKELQIKVLT